MLPQFTDDLALKFINFLAFKRIENVTHLIFQIVPPPHLGKAFLFTQQQHDHSIVSNKQRVALQKKNPRI